MSAAAPAARIQTEITLDAFLWHRTPAVKSYANATLLKDNGDRLYAQLIMGHRVVNWYTGSVRFTARVVNNNGYTNVDTGVMVVDNYDCFFAEMTAHYNAGGVHESNATEPKCVPDPDLLPPTYEPPPNENCPIVIDLARDGYDLSGPDPAVRFDIDGDGELDTIGWTRSGGDEVFPALDRNGNGAIDDGRELFGFATPLLDGSNAVNGYRALAELDTPPLGGNGDGRLDPRDALFGSLLLWRDADRDGTSQPNEIVTAASAGVVALGFHARPTRITDQYGNLFAYRSYVLQSGQRQPWVTYDVVFAEAP